MATLLDAIKSRAMLLSMFAGSIWVVSVANLLLPLHLEQLGVQPRSISGLDGMIFAPWIHGSWGHLLSNTLPLLVLGWLAMVPRKQDIWLAVAGGMLGAGLLAWVIGGSHTVHIGASGVVFGLGSFVVARGLYSRKLLDIAVAVPAVAIYGVSMLAGVLPLYPGVSWESHLGGAVGGFLAAKIMYASTHKA